MSNNKQMIFDLFDMIDQAVYLETLQEEARRLREKVEGETLLDAWGKSNKSYDEIMDFLNGYDDQRSGLPNGVGHFKNIQNLG